MGIYLSGPDLEINILIIDEINLCAFSNDYFWYITITDKKDKKLIYSTSIVATLYHVSANAFSVYSL